jgi:outer membrane protein OmpA-like peptidoglycan-associated protein
MKQALLCMLLLMCNQLFCQKTYTTADNKAIVLYEKGLAEQKNKNYKGALSYFNRALERDNDFGEAYFSKGQIVELEGDILAANSFYETAILKAPRSVNIALAYYSLGVIAFEASNYKKSIDYLNTFISLAPRNVVLVRKSKKIIGNAEFAMEAIKNPLNISPLSLGRTVNVFHSQYFPSLTGDKEMLVFTGFNRATQDENLYVSYLKNNIWAPPVAISPNINTSENEGTAAISADGRTLVFTACNLRNGYGSCDLYVSYKQGNEWPKAVNLGENVNTREWESQPSLSADGRVLYFVSDRRGGKGNRDIYLSRKDDSGQWLPAVNLGAEINTADDEISPFIHPNGITLFFASNGYPGLGGMDLYYTDKNSKGHWHEPQNIGYPLNTSRDQVSLFITADNKTGYYSLEQNQNNDNKNSLLYQFEIPKVIAKNIKKANIVKGVISDAKSKKKLAADIEVYNLKDNTLESKVRSDEQTGEYLNTLNQGGQYGLFVNKPGYFFKSLAFDYSEANDSTSKYIDINLEPLVKNGKEILNNIYFDTNKYELKPESKPELEKLLKLMALNPQMIIEISGHTDDLGKDNENMLLSKNRSNAVFGFLLAKGVAASRIKAVGYGETQPAVENNSTENRAKNRRIEIKIVSI